MSSSIKGKIGKDQLCFNSDVESCLPEQISFVLIDEQKDMEDYGVSGFIGLARESRDPNINLDTFIT